jgi:methyltransferase
MTPDVWWFVGLLGAVGVGRLVEMRVSRRHQKRLGALGFDRAPEPGWRLMVLLHAGVLVGAALEVVVAGRPLLPWLAMPSLAAFVLANALRLWVIRTMSDHWNVNVVNSLALGVVTSGPYRWVRHPNYVAVFVELVALPLVHTAYVTALFGAALHLVVLGRRLAVEDGILLADPGYRAAMAGKPRFLPQIGELFSSSARVPRA